MGTLSLSSLRANVGMTISEGLWNLLLSKLNAWSTGLDSANLAAGGVANSNLASKYHSVVVVDKITPPGMPTDTLDGWWNSAWNTGPNVAPYNNTLGLEYALAFSADHTVFYAPAAMTITEVWTRTLADTASGNVQLWRYPAGGGAAVALSASLACNVAAVNHSSGLALAVGVGDQLCWRCSGVGRSSNLPIVVGFSAKVEHRS